MPHATSDNDSTMSNSAPLTNGASSSGTSKFVGRLGSYPVVADSVETFKSYPIGQKSIDLVSAGYENAVKPVASYLEKPIAYAKPYVAKADELADSGLGQVESHFPIVKEDTTTIVDKGKSVIFYPFTLADNGKTYVVNTWQDEYKKTSSHNNRGEGLQTLIFALISTQLKITSDFFQAVADIIGPRYKTAKENAQDKAEEYKKYGYDKAEQLKKKGDEYVKFGQEKGGEGVKQAQEKGEQIKGEASKKGEEAKQKAGAK